MSRRIISYTIEELEQLIENKEAILLSVDYKNNINTKSKLHLRCKKDNFEWFPTLGSVLRGRWCPKCSGKASPTFEQVKQFVESKGGILLSTEYINNSSKLHLRCKKDNFEWFPRWSGIFFDNDWCPKCSGKASPTLEEIHKLVESKGGILLSTEYINSKSKLHIRCKKDNFEWFPRWGSLLRGRWCPKCAGKSKPTLEEISKFVESKDGTLLSTEYINSNSKLVVKCNKDQCEWRVSWSSLNNMGSWCPVCFTYKTQRKLFNIILEIFPNQKIYSNYTDFDWLKGKRKRKQEIDIYNSTIKLAIEYDGQQHFRPVRFGGISEKIAKKKFKRQKQLDRIKNKKIKQHPEDVKFFIRFSYKDPITKEYVLGRLKKEGVKWK